MNIIWTVVVVCMQASFVFAGYDAYQKARVRFTHCTAFLKSHFKSEAKPVNCQKAILLQDIRFFGQTYLHSGQEIFSSGVNVLNQQHDPGLIKVLDFSTSKNFGLSMDRFLMDVLKQLVDQTYILKNHVPFRVIEATGPNKQKINLLIQAYMENSNTQEGYAYYYRDLLVKQNGVYRLLPIINNSYRTVFYQGVDLSSSVYSLGPEVQNFVGLGDVTKLKTISKLNPFIQQISKKHQWFSFLYLGRLFDAIHGYGKENLILSKPYWENEVQRPSADISEEDYKKLLRHLADPRSTTPFEIIVSKPERLTKEYIDHIKQMFQLQCGLQTKSDQCLRIKILYDWFVRRSEMHEAKARTVDPVENYNRELNDYYVRLDDQDQHIPGVKLSNQLFFTGKIQYEEYLRDNDLKKMVRTLDWLLMMRGYDPFMFRTNSYNLNKQSEFVKTICHIVMALYFPILEMKRGKFTFFESMLKGQKIPFHYAIFIQLVAARYGVKTSIWGKKRWPYGLEGVRLLVHPRTESVKGVRFNEIEFWYGVKVDEVTPDRIHELLGQQYNREQYYLPNE